MKSIIFFTLFLFFSSSQVYAKDKSNSFGAEIANIKNQMNYGEFSNSQINAIKKQMTSNNCNTQESECYNSKLISMQFLTFIETEESENKGQLNTYQNCSITDYKIRKNYCYNYTNIYGATLLVNLLKDEMNSLMEEMLNTKDSDEQNKIYSIYRNHVKLFMSNVGFISQENIMLKKIFLQALTNKYTHSQFEQLNYENQRGYIINLINSNLIVILYSTMDIKNVMELSQTKRISINKKDSTMCKYLFLFDPQNNTYSSCSIR